MNPATSLLSLIYAILLSSFLTMKPPTERSTRCRCPGEAAPSCRRLPEEDRSAAGGSEDEDKQGVAQPSTTTKRHQSDSGELLAEDVVAVAGVKMSRVKVVLKAKQRKGSTRDNPSTEGSTLELPTNPLSPL